MNTWKLASLSLGVAAAIATPGLADAQEQRLVGRLPDAVRVQVDGILDSARTVGLPVEPLVDRALEGAAKGAQGELILRAVRLLADELTIARTAFGDSALPAEIGAGASALRAGAELLDLVRLREARMGRPLTVAAGVLADLVAVGVPTDTAIAAVLALAGGLEDAQYLAFRANVERDIALGASPSAALGTRLSGFSDSLLEVASPNSAPGGLGAAANPPPGKRKP